MAARQSAAESIALQAKMWYRNPAHITRVSCNRYGSAVLIICAQTLLLQRLSAASSHIHHCFVSCYHIITHSAAFLATFLHPPTFRANACRLSDASSRRLCAPAGHSEFVNFIIKRRLICAQHNCVRVYATSPRRTLIRVGI